jgi:hypothetical protein
MTIIEAVQRSGIVLKTFGDRFVGLCPFHKENSPSFNVYPHTDSFYCFGCEVGGDVRRYVKLHPMLKGLKLYDDKYDLNFLKTKLDAKRCDFVDYSVMCDVMRAALSDVINVVEKSICGVRQIKFIDDVSSWYPEFCFLKTDVYAFEWYVEGLLNEPKIKRTYEDMNLAHIKACSFKKHMNDIRLRIVK